MTARRVVRGLTVLLWAYSLFTMGRLYGRHETHARWMAAMRQLERTIRR